MDKKPLVLAPSGELEQLQPGDCIADTVSPAEFNRLRHQFRKLLQYLVEEEIEIPESLIEEFNLE